jgi:hypothetical protein
MCSVVRSHTFVIVVGGAALRRCLRVHASGANSLSDANLKWRAGVSDLFVPWIMRCAFVLDFLSVPPLASFCEFPNFHVCLESNMLFSFSENEFTSTLKFVCLHCVLYFVVLWSPWNYNSLNFNICLEMKSVICMIVLFPALSIFQESLETKESMKNNRKQKNQNMESREKMFFRDDCWFPLSVGSSRALSALPVSKLLVMSALRSISFSCVCLCFLSAGFLRWFLLSLVHASSLVWSGRAHLLQKSAATPSSPLSLNKENFAEVDS